MQVSTDGGATYTSIACSNTRSDNVPNAHPLVLANVPGYSGLQDAFQTETCNLPAYAGQTVILLFRAVSDWSTIGNDADTANDGWFIDDVLLGGTLLSERGPPRRAPLSLFAARNTAAGRLVDMRPLLLCLLVLALPVGAAGAVSAPVPRGLPLTLQIGLADPPGGAAALRRSGHFGFRYQYLAGGVNTGDGWATWDSDGSFVTRYVEESARAGVVPFFSYYMIRQSPPGRTTDDEARADLGNLANDATRTALLSDLELFMRRAGAFAGRTVVLQLEPDLWGYAQQAARDDDAATVPHAREFARAVVALRDRLAPNVLLAYHVSIWGTKVDIAISDPPDREVDALAARAAAFYRSLGARFDLATAEFSDRDSSFKQKIQGAGAWAWWRPADFRRHARFVAGFSRRSGLRVALWQIPLGNTRMRAMDDTWSHYRDNRVEWLLDDASRAHLRAYVRAGVIALLFGGGAEGTTCACDAAKDGVTDPAPVAGNKRRSLSADDDGGFFRDRVRAYYRRGPLKLAR